MTRTIACFTPFAVCLSWFFVFLANYRKHDPAKRLLTWFLATCTVLYFCHGIYFTQGPQYIRESVWALCSMSVYPLYYGYICRLTSDNSRNTRLLLSLLPGALVALAILLFPGRETDTARQMLMTIQIIAVAYYGYKQLIDFDQKLAEVYADMEGRSTRPIQNLLTAFLVMSILSAMANAIGKQEFAHESRSLYMAATVFSVMLFLLSYIGYTRSFSINEFAKDYACDDDDAGTGVNLVALGENLERLMQEQRLYLKQNLKIAEVATAAGSCRTYVSMYLNQVRGTTFSDYINSMRIEYAKHMLKDDRKNKNAIVAEKAGFMSEQAFYRNFKKHTGMNPQEWIRANAEPQTSAVLKNV